MTYETTCRMPKKDGSWLWTVDKGKVIRAYAARILAGSAPQTPEDALSRLRSRERERWVSDTTMKVTVGGESFFQCIISDVSRFVREREEGSAPQTPEDAIYRLRSREGERWVSDTTMKVTVGARASSSASSPM